MIRIFRENDLTAVIQIWLDTNIKAHNFIPKEYWMSNYAMVKDTLPQAEIYVYVDDETKEIDGFIGLMDNYIAGIFVKEAVQSKGIGKQLLDYVKEIKSNMRLSVYQKNTRAIVFYQREQFVIQSENIDDSTNEKEFIMAWSKSE
ncbi:N-acetyltransferase [Bariatricus sp. SGI.154]|uniref:N-acetyltransferase n=1 Tax=Bariatricus sp. SGI.154 TaxID=3420549 RepID=UPI003CFBE73A